MVEFRDKAFWEFSVTNPIGSTLRFLPRTYRLRQFLHVDRSGADLQSCNCVQEKFASLGIRSTVGGLAIQQQNIVFGHQRQIQLLLRFSLHFLRHIELPHQCVAAITQFGVESLHRELAVKQSLNILCLPVSMGRENSFVVKLLFFRIRCKVNDAGQLNLQYAAINTEEDMLRVIERLYFFSL